MSSLYIEASKIIQQFWNKRASLKTLVYGSHSDKKVNELMVILRYRDICLRYVQKHYKHSIYFRVL